MKKFLSIILAIAMLLTAFAGCKRAEKEHEKTTAGGGTVQDSAKTIRFLNFKPEIAGVYEKIVKDYKQATGVTVVVETAASGTYESTLKAKMATSQAPTIFQINGPKGYATWKDFCADLTSTKLYSILKDKTMAIKVGEKAYGIPYVVEGYGIIYNQAIMDKYFKMDKRSAKVNSVAEIDSFAKLKDVAEDMQSKKADLGIKGVFAATSLKSGEDWRWQTHLANVPLYYEFQTNKIDLTGNATNQIEFKYAENFKNVFDLYINNSTTDKKLLGSKIVDDSMAEFALGECAMVQNGNWAWSQISKVTGNTVKSENVKFMPIYTGYEGESKQGICIGTENFFCINSKATAAEQKAADEFLYWLNSSEKGKSYVTNDLGFISPFNTFKDDEKPKDPLAQEVLKWMEKDGIKYIPWNFTIFPSQTFKDDFGAGLLQYAQGTKNWNDLKASVIKSWKTESTLASE